MNLITRQCPADSRALPVASLALWIAASFAASLATSAAILAQGAAGRPKPPQAPDPVPIMLQSGQALPFLDWDHLLYGRESRLTAPDSVTRKYRSALRPVLSPTPLPFDRNKLILALSHESPHVRTLAALALFDANDPHMLPHLAKLLDDSAKTIPMFQHISVIAFPTDEGSWKPPTYEGTVGDAVRAMLEFYVRRVGGDSKRFDEYWEPRKNRRYCTSWFSAHLDRITGGSSQPKVDSTELQVLLGRIQALPPREADWALIAVFTHTGLSNMVTSDERVAMTTWMLHEDELLRAARRRGRAALLDVLRGKHPTDDPDMPHYHQGIVDFILRHAARLLDPTDADYLFKTARESKSPLAAWFQAAARLAPERASEILHVGLQKIPNQLFGAHMRARLVQDLWQVSGAKETAFVVEWFYDPSHVQLGGIPPRTTLLEFLSKRYNAIDRALLRKLIEDERFDGLDSQTTREMVIALNRVLPEPLVATWELFNLGHPYGLHHFDKWIEKAKIEHPGPTKELLATLVAWRKKIRDVLSKLK